MKIRNLFIIIWVLICSLNFAQAIKLQAVMIIQKPTPPSISDWKLNPNVSQLIITNISGAPINNVYVSFSFKNISTNKEVAHSVDRYARRFNMPIGTKIRNAGDVLPNDYTNGIWMDPSFQNVLYTTNKLPEGTYQMCAHINNELDQNISGPDACDMFTVIVPTQPRIISPIDTNAVIVGLPIFNWIPVTPLPPGADIKYELKIVPVYLGQSLQDAIDRNDVLLVKTLSMAAYQYQTGDPSFSTYTNQLKCFAWQVRAFDANNFLTIQNQGKSEIGCFSLNNIDPPSLLTPLDTNIFVGTPPMLSWSAISPPIGSMAKYNLKVAPLYKGKTPVQALQGTQLLLNRSNLSSPFYQSTYSDSIMTRFSDAPYFAWQVQVVNQNGSIITKNNGFSDIKIFKVTRVLTPQNFRDTGSILITANTPLGEGKYPRSPKPTFSVIVTPPISPAAIDSGNLYVWKMASSSASAVSVKGKDAAFHYAFSGNNTSAINVTRYGSNSSRIDLPLVNSDGPGGQTFIPDTGATYLWTFSINYKADKIRVDGKKCSQAIQASDDGKFTVVITKQDSTSIKIATLKPAKISLFPDNKQPLFSVGVTPPINPEAITGSSLTIWKMAKPDDDVTKTKNSVSDFTATFPDNDGLQVSLNKQTKDTTYLDLSFLNTPTGTKTFKADSGSPYLWNFTLSYDKENIRKDSLVCSKSSQVSNDGMFTVAEMPDSTLIRVFANLPGSQIKYPDEKMPKFAVYVSPLVNKTAIQGGTLSIWKIASEKDDPEQVKKTTPSFIFPFTGNDDKILKATTISKDSMRLDLTYLNTSSNKSNIFTVDSGKVYLWNLTLNYDKSKIRLDGVIPSRSSQKSTDGISRAGIESGACADNCSAPVPTNTTPNQKGYTDGDIIRVGKFLMKVSTSTGIGNALTGTGSIKVPFLRAPISVQFSNIKVNTDNQMYDGEIDALQSTDSPISQTDANRLSGSFGLSNDQVTNIYNVASSAKKLVSSFTGTEPISLPIGFNNTINGEQIVIGVIGMVWTATNAKLNAAISVQLPQLGPGVSIGLGARDLCFHPNGLGGDGNATIYLPNDFGYNSGSDANSWSTLFKAKTDQDSGTYINFDCHGFKKFQMALEVKFPRTWLVPDSDSTGNGQVVARVTALVEKKSGSWQWLGTAKMSKCQIPSVPGLKLDFQDITYDNSSVANPPGITFPDKYQGSTKEDWTGFYMKRVAVTLPDSWRPRGINQPLQVSINNMIISKAGVNFSVRLENLLKYPLADFGGWSGSIDTVAIDVINSSLQRGSIMGRIHVPIFDSSLVYTASLSSVAGDNGLRSLGYQFVVSPKDTMRANLWHSNIALDNTSKIEISNLSGKFVASAQLNGQISFDGSIGSYKGIDIKGIKFQGFKIQSTAPYFQKGTWSLASPQKWFNGFPITINNIDILQGTRSNKTALGIQFNVGVQLTNGANGIGGSTTLKLWGVLNDDGNGQKLAFDGIELDSISVNANMGPVDIKGGVKIYNSDATYGSGFCGAVTATFAKKITIKATAQFGIVNNYSYWYVDASGAFNAGIPIFSGAGIYGFGGGAWYHMRKTGADPALMNLPKTANPNTGTTAGLSNSGYKYVPDNSVNFGFRAMVILGSYPRPESFNGDVAFEMQFLADGGIKSIALNGQGYLMVPIDQRDKARVRAALDIAYDFPNSVMHGTFNAQVMMAPVLTGQGTMVMHADTTTWYIKIGDPSNPFNLKYYSTLNFNAYLMMGKNLPGIPMPPSQVLNQLTASQRNSITTSRDNKVTTGDGIAFGASLSFDTGRQSFLIFYGQVSAGGGFDIVMLKQNKCPGINGWQGQGQFYAYLNAEIGLHVEIGFWLYRPCGPWYCYICRWCQAAFVGTRGDFTILRLSGAALLQVGGPNPWWATGTVNGEYSILGGLVHGSCHFNFSKGTACQL